LKAVEGKPSKPSPTASPLLFEVDPEPLPETQRRARWRRRTFSVKLEFARHFEGA
jgi:hypothetical protein